MLAILETEAMDSLERRKEHALQLGGKGRNKTAFPNDVNVIDCYGNYYGSGIYDDVSAGRRKGRYNYEKCNKKLFFRRRCDWCC